MKLITIVDQTWLIIILLKIIVTKQHDLIWSPLQFLQTIMPRSATGRYKNSQQTKTKHVNEKK